MKMDHGDGFTFYFLTAGMRLYYSQSSPLSPRFTCSTPEARCTHFGLGFSAFFRMCVCVCVCGVWPPEFKNLPALWNLLCRLVNREMLIIQPSSIWPHSSWSSYSVRSPVKWCPLSALNVTNPKPLLQNRIPTDRVEERDLSRLLYQFWIVLSSVHWS